MINQNSEIFPPIQQTVREMEQEEYILTQPIPSFKEKLKEALDKSKEIETEFYKYFQSMRDLEGLKLKTDHIKIIEKLIQDVEKIISSLKNLDDDAKKLKEEAVISEEDCSRLTEIFKAYQVKLNQCVTSLKWVLSNLTSSDLVVIWKKFCQRNEDQSSNQDVLLSYPSHLQITLEKAYKSIEQKKAVTIKLPSLEAYESSAKDAPILIKEVLTHGSILSFLDSKHLKSVQGVSKDWNNQAMSELERQENLIPFDKINPIIEKIAEQIQVKPTAETWTCYFEEPIDEKLELQLQNIMKRYDIGSFEVEDDDIIFVPYRLTLNNPSYSLDKPIKSKFVAALFDKIKKERDKEFSKLFKIIENFSLCQAKIENSELVLKVYFEDIISLWNQKFLIEHLKNIGVESSLISESYVVTNFVKNGADSGTGIEYTLTIKIPNSENQWAREMHKRYDTHLAVLNKKNQEAKIKMVLYISTAISNALKSNRNKETVQIAWSLDCDLNYLKDETKKEDRDQAGIKEVLGGRFLEFNIHALQNYTGEDPLILSLKDNAFPLLDRTMSVPQLAKSPNQNEKNTPVKNDTQENEIGEKYLSENYDPTALNIPSQQELQHHDTLKESNKEFEIDGKKSHVLPEDTSSTPLIKSPEASSSTPKRPVVLLDVDGTLIMHDGNYNKALISNLNSSDIKDIYLFTNMDLIDIVEKKSNPINYKSRPALVAYLKKKGFKVHGVITPADVGYKKGLGMAYEEIFLPQYERSILHDEGLTLNEKGETEKDDSYREAEGKFAKLSRTEERKEFSQVKGSMFKYFLENKPAWVGGCVFFDDDQKQLESAVEACNKYGQQFPLYTIRIEKTAQSYADVLKKNLNDISKKLDITAARAEKSVELSSLLDSLEKSSRKLNFESPVNQGLEASTGIAELNKQTEEKKQSGQKDPALKATAKVAGKTLAVMTGLYATTAFGTLLAGGVKAALTSSAVPIAATFKTVSAGIATGVTKLALLTGLSAHMATLLTTAGFTGGMASIVGTAGIALAVALAVTAMAVAAYGMYRLYKHYNKKPESHEPPAPPGQTPSNSTVFAPPPQTGTEREDSSGNKYSPHGA